MEEAKTPQYQPHNWVFYTHSVLVFSFCSLCYALVFFHQSAPAVVSESMSIEFKVPPASLTIFSSVFFWTYAIMQPFGGLLADVMDPAYLIGSAAIVAASGCLICGISKSLTMAVIGRLIVGLGAAPTYVPVCKILTRWYPKRWYAIFGGLVLAIGGCGGIIAQAPLAAFAKSFGWRWAFIGVSGIGALMGILVLLFVRLDPTKFGYAPVNPDTVVRLVDRSFSEMLTDLWNNFKIVTTKPVYYFIAVYAFSMDGSFYNLLGLWGGPYIRDVFPNFGDGKMLTSLSIAMIAGSLILPIASDVLKTRKWVLFAVASVYLIISILFILFDTYMSFSLMFLCMFLWGMCTGAACSVYFPTVKEHYDASVGATAIGCTNIFAFMGGAVSQTISGIIISKYEMIGTKYPHKAYKNGLWLVIIIYSLSATVASLLISEPEPVAEAASEPSEDEAPKEI